MDKIFRHKDSHTTQENQHSKNTKIHVHKTHALKPNCNTLKQFATHYCSEDWFYEEMLSIFLDTQFEYHKRPESVSHR